MRSSFPHARRLACETGRKLRPALPVLVLTLTVVVLALPAGARADQPEHAAGAATVPKTHGAPDQEGAAHEEKAEEGILAPIARIVNFAILAGTLVYLFRSPLGSYLVDRSAGIRSDLVNAAETKQAAARQIEDIDRRMKALPGELEALRAQGAQEIAAEEERIRAAVAAERDRLLEQARREIDLQVKVAERELVAHAADLAVGVASERIRKNITDDDQKRLVDRYVQQLKS